MIDKLVMIELEFALAAYLRMTDISALPLLTKVVSFFSSVTSTNS